MEFSLLEHFIAVAQTSSFARAAALLHASPSVVTRSIQRLEAQVGTKLLERTTRSVKLTPAGEELLNEALFLRGHAAVATEKVRRIGKNDSNRFRVGFCPSADPEMGRIAQALLAFRSKWPSLDLKLKTVRTA